MPGKSAKVLYVFTYIVPDLQKTEESRPWNIIYRAQLNKGRKGAINVQIPQHTDTLRSSHLETGVTETWNKIMIFANGGIKVDCWSFYIALYLLPDSYSAANNQILIVKRFYFILIGLLRRAARYVL